MAREKHAAKSRDAISEGRSCCHAGMMTAAYKIGEEDIKFV